MTKQRISLRLTLLSLLIVPGVPAQLVSPDGAWRESAPLPGVAVGLRLDDSSRKVQAGGLRRDFDRQGAAVIAQAPLTPGISLWAEAGAFRGELAGIKADGGGMYGIGISARPLRIARRIDPDIGPREWTALRVDAGYRAGSASTSRRGDLDWNQWEARLGVEDHQVFLGPRRGAMNTTALTLEAGLLLTDLRAEIEGYKSSSRNNAGLYLRGTFATGDSGFYGLEADWMGSSDRRFGVFAGIRF